MELMAKQTMRVEERKNVVDLLEKGYKDLFLKDENIDFTICPKAKVYAIITTECDTNTDTEVGIIVATPSGPVGSDILISMCMKEEFRGKKLGIVGMSMFCHIAKEQGYQYVYAWVPKGVQVEPFMEKCMFRKLDSTIDGATTLYSREIQ